MADFTVYQGDDLPLKIPVSVQGVVDTTAGAELEFTIFTAPGLPRSQALLVRITDAITNPIQRVPPKTFVWTVSPADLAGLAVNRSYKWYVRYKGADGVRATLDEGAIKLLAGVRPE